MLFCKESWSRQLLKAELHLWNDVSSTKTTSTITAAFTATATATATATTVATTLAGWRRHLQDGG